MRLPDLALEARPRASIVSEPASVAGWGGGPAAPVSLVAPAEVEQLRAALELCRGSGNCVSGVGVGVGVAGAIPRGMGRSYGDAAQLSDGVVIDTRRLRGFELDAERGTVTAQAGVTIGELLGPLVSAGWVVPVLPGTQHVTVGGAIASDIHGKNHGTVGTFGSHVQALGLLTASGELLELEPGAEDRCFEATLGGMGLTGVIVWARIALRRVGGPLLSVDTDRASTLDQVLALLREPGGQHRVAWLDLLGSRPGRGVVTRAEHLEGWSAPDGPRGVPARVFAPPAQRAAATIQARATVPAWFPAGVLRPSTVRAFNELRFRRAPAHRRGNLESLGSHMFPLDALSAWPRLYGPRGLLQYQLVVPSGREGVLETVIERLARGRVACYLAVLKDFGPANDAPLSFPIGGWTLALDLPRAAPGIDAVLDQLDELVIAAGGRVYLTKDARLRQDAVRAMYPRLDEWRAVRDRVDPERLWRSDLALRTGLVSAT